MADFLNNLRLPSGLDEGDLLSWIEGEPMLAPRRAAVVAWLAREPQVAAAIEAMRKDRSGLVSLGNEVAPSHLLSGIASHIEPLLERQMLLGLAEGTDLHDHPPVSVVRPVRQPFFAALFADRLGRGIAVAAVLLLLVGGTTYFMAQSLSGPGPGSGPIKPRYAKNTETSPLDEESAALTQGNTEQPQATIASSEAASAGNAMDSARSLRAMPPMPPNPFEGEVAIPPALTLAAEDPPQMGPFPDESAQSIDSMRAAELAREGRLVIRVKARDPGLIIRPDRLATRLKSAQSPAWTVEGEASAQVAQAVAEPFPPDLDQRLPAPERLTLAGADPARFPNVPPEMLYGPPAPSIQEAAAAGPAVYSVQARLDPAALTRLRQVIAGAGGDVEFEETAEPLPGSDEPTLNAPSILWWGQSPAGWTRWARIPVVIDIRR